LYEGIAILKTTTTGRFLVHSIDDPSFKLIVKSHKFEPVALSSSSTTGTLLMNFDEEEGISFETRIRLRITGQRDHQITVGDDNNDFDNQISRNIGVIVGHELGHLVAGRKRDEDEQGRNTQINENAIRSELGLPLRKFYGAFSVAGANNYSGVKEEK
jgi:hypothetical protein